MIAWLVGVAFAVTLDRAPSGALVTVRPDAGERVAIVDGRGRPLDLDLPPMWAVNPESWRAAVASGEELQLRIDQLRQLDAVLQAASQDLEARTEQLSLEQQRSATLQSDVNRLESDSEHLRRQRLGFAGAGFAAGAVSVLAFLLVL